MPSLKTAIGIKVKEILGIQAYSVGRRLTIFDDDVFLVSYPKSGNTWTRFLIGNLLYPETDITFANIQNIIPDIYLTSDRQLHKIPRPRLLKSHEYFDPSYKKVIFIVRDPRDVLLSSYFHFIKYGLITEAVSLEEFGEKFLLGQYHFVRNSNPLGTWLEHTGSWLGARKNDDNFLLLRYEDFQTDLPQQLRTIANFMAIDCTDSTINRAISNSSIERMRQLESQQPDVWPNKYTKKDISFIRTAVSGEGKCKLPQSILERTELLWGETMKELGYKTGKLLTETKVK